MGLVSWLIAIPFLTAVVIILTPASRDRTIRWIAATGCGIHLLLTGVLTWLYFSRRQSVEL